MGWLFSLVDWEGEGELAASGGFLRQEKLGHRVRSRQAPEGHLWACASVSSAVTRTTMETQRLKRLDNMDGAWHTGHALVILIHVAVTVVTM